jgi:hypothetical protein
MVSKKQNCEAFVEILVSVPPRSGTHLNDDQTDTGDQ